MNFNRACALAATILMISSTVSTRADEGPVAHKKRTKDSTPVFEQEQRVWINNLIPLPHEITIPAKVVLPPKDVAILVFANAGDIEQQAAGELRTLFGEKAGVEPEGSKFKIFLGVLDAKGKFNGQDFDGAERLKECRNSNQAYLIRPLGETGLIIAGLDARGVYYGVQTLRQLLEPHLGKNKVEIPLAKVTDWPDMTERGMWNSPLQIISYEASLKLNHHSLLARFKGKFTRDREPAWDMATLALPDGTEVRNIDWARRHAMTPFGQLPHINYWHRYGLYDVYPELKGKGPGATDFSDVSHERPVPCATHPVLETLLTQSLRDLAQDGVPEIAVWQSEFEAQCGCDTCAKVGQCQAEVDAILPAWETVKKDFPDLRLRIFFCLGNHTPDLVRRCLKALPSGVIIEKVYGWKPLFEEAATRGQKVIRYSGWMLNKPHSVGIRHYTSYYRDRLTHGYEKRLAGVLPLYKFYSKDASAYNQRVHSYNFSGLAEWSWNVKGRTPREFAVAWATREGYADPAKVADWVELMEPVESAIIYKYRPRWHFTYDAAKSFREGKACTFLDDRIITDGLVACRHALGVAEVLDKPDLAAETRHVMAVLWAHERLNALSAAVAGRGDEGGGKRLRAALQNYVTAVRSAATSLDPLMDLLTVEPTSFAGKLKQQQAEGWKKAEQDITAAVFEWLK